MKFTNIQVIRLAAALSVFLLHLGYYSQRLLGVRSPAIEFIAEPFFGFGVFAFFTVSGFVLAHSLQTTPVPTFIVLRFARIYPPYWVAYAAVIGGQLLLGEVPTDIGYWRCYEGHILRALALVPSGGDQAYYALAVEWTLVYEVFFYAALALLALTGRRWGVPVGAAIWLCLCLGRIVAAPSLDGMRSPTWNGIILSPMIPPFLFGVLAYYMRDWAKRIQLWSPLIGTTLIAVGYTLGRPDVEVFMAGAGFALIVLWAAGNPQLPTQHRLVRFGDFSYGVYLAHVPIMKGLFTMGVAWAWVPPTVAGVVATGLTTLLIGFGYGWLETRCYSKMRGWLAPAKGRVAVAPILPR